MLTALLLLALVIVVAVVHWRTMYRLGKATGARDHAVQKQGKALARRAAQSEVRASQTHEECERLLKVTNEMHEDARLLHQRADALLREVNDRG